MNHKHNNSKYSKLVSLNKINQCQRTATHSTTGLHNSFKRPSFAHTSRWRTDVQRKVLPSAQIRRSPYDVDGSDPSKRRFQIQQHDQASISKGFRDSQWRMWCTGWHNLKRPLNKGQGRCGVITSYWHPIQKQQSRDILLEHIRERLL